MGTRLISVHVGDARHLEGKCVNVYSSYANALAHGSTGLSTIYGVNKLDGTVGSAISQTAKEVGVKVDQDGCIHFFAEENTTYYLKSDGLWTTPRRIDVGAA